MKLSYFDNNTGVQGMIQYYAEQTPNKVALIFQEQAMTYAELEEYSSNLAEYLQQQGVGKGDFVAVYLKRSLDLIVSLIAIQKAGAAYLPIDFDYPEDRMAFMIADARAKAILTHSAYQRKLPATTAITIPLDKEWATIQEETTNNKKKYHSCTARTDVAYMIYTSGSTGQPKGVLITHENIFYQLEGQQAIAPAPIQKMLLTCSISFDVSVLTIYWTFFQGATLVIPEQGEEKDIQRLADTIERHYITHILTLPSLYTMVLGQANPHKLQSLELINVSGEACPISLAQKHEALLPNCQLYNLYGPTEATVNCTYFTFPKGFAAPKVPIGIPIKNYELFILKEDLSEVGDGEVGEIYIGGSQPVVGKGYWNRPTLSAERFIDNPFKVQRGGATLYKTGDLGRWMTDGNIEFLGRSDFQVKYRGFRIELGEIEVAIGHYPLVKEVVVVLKDQELIGKQRLVAYVTLNESTNPNSETTPPLPNRGLEGVGTLNPNSETTPPLPKRGLGGVTTLNVTNIRQFLATSLPEYMLPTNFVVLKRMPLTPNGKFNRKALPYPLSDRPHLAQRYEAPTTPLEKHLTEIWEQLLQVQPIGRNDKFFELGGNSIQAAQFIGQLQKQYEASIFVTTIFDFPTIATYAKMLETKYDTELKSTEQQGLPNAQSTNQAEAEKEVATKPLTEWKLTSFSHYLPRLSQLDTSKEKNLPAIFILAPPRSGTSLLRLMLAGHPDLFAVNELKLLGHHSLKERNEAFVGKYSLWQEGAIRAVMALKKCDVATARQHIQGFVDKGYTTKRFYQQLQRWAAPKIIVDKTPSYALDPLALQKAEQDFDNPIFIHLVRHPHAMVQSFEKYRMDQVVYVEEHPYTARELGELIWYNSHQNIQDFLKSIPTNRKFELQYEDLVKTPEQIMRQLCEQVALDFHPALLSPYAHIDTKLVDGIHKDSRSMSDSNLHKYKSINAAKAEEWKAVGTNNYLSESTWQLAKELGYVYHAEEQPLQKTSSLQALVSVANQQSEVDGAESENISFNTCSPKKVYTNSCKSLRTHPLSETIKEGIAASLKARPLATNQGSTTTPPTGYAIVGMSCRLPGANSLSAFWHNLVNGVDTSEAVTAADLEKAGLDPTILSDPNYVARRYSLDHPDCFDAAFFGYHPKEAAMMDPQHRVLLEVAYNCLENAGYNPFDYDGKIGVFGGIARNAYFSNNIATHPDLLESVGEYLDTLGSEKTFSISRIAYKLNLKGPAVNVQTACSSSGTAVHLACQSLQNGDADMVLVAGGRIQPPLLAGYVYKEGGPLSPDGYVKAFDAAAKGMVRGHGMACILLKKIDQAIADKDHIWAVIKSTATNNDGADKIGFTAPSAKGQTVAIQESLTKAGLSAKDIDYVEAHGTGTLLGDPIELEALTQAFRQSTDQQQFCGIGSVKTAIGHLDAGACVVGIIKTALALKMECLPPSLHFQTPNPQINFDQSPFYVNATVKAWTSGERIRRAGVSSFGLGGTNAHIILEEAPREIQNSSSSSISSSKLEVDLNVSLNTYVNSTLKVSKEILSDDSIKEAPFLNENRLDRAYQLLLLSAKTATALEQQVQQLQEYLVTPKTPLQDVAYTLATGRTNFKYRSALLVGEGVAPEGKVFANNEGHLPTTEAIVWMFPGGGAQYVGMAKDLYAAFPVFKEAIDYCIQFLKEKEDLNITPLLLPEDGATIAILQEQIKQPCYALASLFTIEYALAKLWLHWGIRPTELIGHSMGEYTAACLAGVFSVEDGLRLVTLRGRLFESLEQEGSMLSVALSEAEIQSYIIENTSIAVINKPDNCVLSGTKEAIDKLENQFKQKEIDCSRIHIKVAAHSSQIDPIIPEFEQFLDTIKLNTTEIPIISNVSGVWVQQEEMATTTYWVNHLRRTVRFADGLALLLEQPNKIFLEIGPGQTLSTFAKQHPAKAKSHSVFPSIRHPKEPTNDVAFLLKTLGNIWSKGIEINWTNYYQSASPNRVPLPTYPFARTVHWIAPNQKKSPLATPNTIDKSSNAPLLTSNSSLITHHSPLFTPLMATPNRKTHLITLLKQTLYELSGLEPTEMEIDATFLELGFDSLFLSQAVIQFNRQFDLDISFRSLFETTPSIESLAEYIDEELPADQFQPALEKVISANGIATSTNQASTQNNFLDLNFTQTEKSSMEILLRQQLQLMQQQLLILGGNRQSDGLRVKSDELNKRSKEVAGGNEEIRGKSGGEVAIKRSAKGVTAKLNNYKKIATTNELTAAQKAALQTFIERYTAKTPKSKAQASIHKKYYADPRSVTGFSTLWKEMVYQIAAEKSKGAKIWDIDGNEYIDYVMSYGMALFGHAPDFIQKAIRKQLEKGNSLDILPPKATEIAKMICEVSGMDRATLANTGTEAVLGTVRAARTYSGKDRIAVFDTDYHGLVGQFMLRGVHFKNTSKAMPAAPGIPKKVVEDTLVLDYDDPYVLDKLTANIKDLAAVIIEPVQAQNPHWQHHKLIRAIRKITAEHDVALIFDEIINGFRLAQKGAQAWFGVEADLVAYGKSISGGLPLSALAGKEKYMRAFDGGLWQFGDDSRPEASVTYFASTFIKNPLSVSAGHAALTELVRQGPALQEDLNQKTKIFATQVKAIFLRLKAPYMIQATASMYMIKPIDANPLTRLFTYFLRMRGINMRERPCFISTAHTEADFQKTYEALELAIQDMFQEGLIQEYVGEDMNVIYENQPLLEKVAEVAPLIPIAATTASVNNDTPTTVPIDSTPITIPLTDGQEEIWLSHQFSTEAAAAYNIVTELQLKGQLDTEHLLKAIEQLIQRHESLRTTFAMDGKSQTISTTTTPYWEAISCKDITEIEQQVMLNQIRKSETETPFDLTEGPLVRFIFVEQSEEEHTLFINVHHIICDGWSLGILTRELGELYSKLVGTPHNILPAPKKLRDFVQEKIDHQQSKKYQKDEAFWLARFEDKIPIVDIPTDYPRSAVKTYPAAQEKLPLTAGFYNNLKKAAAKAGTTPYIFIMAAFKAFLMRLSGQKEVIFGMAAAGHNLSGNANMVGHLISLLPIRSTVGEGQTFQQFLKEVRGNVLDGFDHQNYTFGTLVKKRKIQRAANRNTLVSVAFNMDSPLGQMNYGGLNLTTQMIPKRFEIFDAFINLKPIEDRLDFEWTFNADLFTRATIQLRLQEFQVLLEEVIKDNQLMVEKIPLLPTTEIETLKQFNNGLSLKFPTEARLTTLFEQQVKRQPEKIAIVSGDTTISYHKLNERVNRLAHFLRKEGLKVGDYVGLCMNGSIDLIVAIYGILKAGGVYVPIDPRNPKERKQLILEDAKCGVLISELGVGDFPAFKGIHYVLEQLSPPLKLENRHNLNLTITSKTEAYIIYTSGSTGLPKGVAIPHRNAINTLYAIDEHLQLNSDDRVYSVSSMSFDMSIPDYFLTLIKGATLILAKETTKKDGFALREDLERHRPTFMQATPTTWKILLLSGWQGDAAMTIVAGGEGFSKELASRLLKITKAVWNGYGPTETTIYATYKAVTADYLERKAYGEFVPIGQPIANVDTLILDEAQQPVPIGVPGELYIGGAGVASGYKNRWELTTAKFVTLTNEVATSMHWYKTGDLVRYLPNGDIDFLGRIDTQVKIRGFRIELGEIEATLNQHPHIQQSIVTVLSEASDRKELVAYYIPINNVIEEGAIKAFLKEKLPGYMVPTFYMPLETFPQNTSLKVDRTALPKPNRTTLAQSHQYIAPELVIEKQLATYWKTILKVDQISIHDDFFDLGGHSLVAVELLSTIYKSTGVKLPITSLFQNATIYKQAKLLEKATQLTHKKWTSLVPIRPEGKKQPIYLVHGGGLHVLFYQSLVRQLDEEQPIYALQAKGLDGESEPLDTIEAMATHYINEMLDQNPTGPYHLAGYSLGGLIAYEIAKQLKEMGKEVGVIALFDAVAKDNWSEEGKFEKFLKKTGYNFSILMKNPIETINYKSTILKRRYQHLIGKVRVAYQDTATQSVEEGLLPYGKKVYEKSLAAFWKYELVPCNFSVLLFKAKDQMFYLKDPEYNGWKPYALGGVEVFEVEGNHHNLFDGSGTERIAAILQKYMDQFAASRDTVTGKA